MSTGVPGGISAVLINCLVESYDISFGLGHLIALDIDVAIAVVSSRPKLFILPDGCVVEQRHGQVVLDQILSRAAQVQWIPVQEGFPHEIEFIRWHFSALVFLAKQDIAPEVVRKVFRLDAEQTWNCSLDVALQIVSDGVVGEVNGTV